MKPTNLNMLFQDLILNFVHLVPINKTMEKSAFLDAIKSTYDISNPKTALFYESAKRSEFDTIKRTNEHILFNQ